MTSPITPKMIEALAKALHEYQRSCLPGKRSPSWDKQLPEFHEHMLSMARAALAAAEVAPKRDDYTRGLQAGIEAGRSDGFAAGVQVESREVAWLIERNGEWWSASISQWHEGRSLNPEEWRNSWTASADKALRFARKEDAEAMIRHVGWQNALATEHIWIGSPLSASEPSAALAESEGAQLRCRLGPEKLAHAPEDWPGELESEAEKLPLSASESAGATALVKCGACGDMKVDGGAPAGAPSEVLLTGVHPSYRK